MSEADLRAGYARRGDHLRRLLLEREESNATIAQAAALIIEKDEEVRDADARADEAEARADEAEARAAEAEARANNTGDVLYVEQDTAGQHNTRVPFTSEARSHRYHNISTQHHNTTCDKNDIIS